MFGLNIIEASSVGSSGLSATRLGEVRASINAAAEIWGHYIDAPNAVIDVELSFGNLGGALATAGASFTASGGTFESVVTQELAGNRDISAGVRDATLNIDISDLRDEDFYFYDTSFEPDPEGFRPDQFDFLSVLIHEFGHILGLVVASNFTTPFGALTQVINGVNHFIGRNTVEANGGNPLAITGSHLASEDLLDPSISNGQRGLITPIHIAIWEDLGIPIVAATSGANTLYGFELVDDTISALGGNDVVHGLTGNDTLLGGAGSDTLVGGLGLDTLTGGSGADIFQFDVNDDGAIITDLSEQDALRFVSSSAAQTVLNTAQQSGANTVLTFNGSQITLRNVDDASLSRSGSEIAITEASSGASQGNDDDDTIRYNAVSELEAGEIVDGGSGTDRLVFADMAGGTFDLSVAQVLDIEVIEFSSTNSPAEVILGANNVAELGRSEFAFDFLVDGNDATGTVETLTVNTPDGGLSLAGWTFEDWEATDRIVLNGSSQNDTLIGSNQNDEISGGAGDDRLSGASGADGLDGGDGIDTVDYSASTSRISVNLTTGIGLGGDAHGDSFTNIENIIGTNSTFTDFLTGNAGDNVIVGLGGGDQIDGGDGIDTVDYSASTSRISVNLTTGIGLGGDAQGDSFTNIENIIGTNSTLTDFLTGNAGDNVIAGLGGGDQINGKAGDDTLIGGSGQDTFFFDAGFGEDTITDFEDDIDTLDFSNVNSAFTSANVAGDAVYTFNDGSVLTVQNISIGDLADDLIT